MTNDLAPWEEDQTMTETKLAMARVMDKRMRATLIAVAENIENLLKDGKISEQTPMNTNTIFGLSVNVKLQVREEKPPVMTFTYSMNKEIWKKWLSENPQLTEGPLAFTCKGIEIVIPCDNGKAEVESTGFSIDDAEGERIWLRLLEKDVKFLVHRDIFKGKEWEIFLEDS